MSLSGITFATPYTFTLYASSLNHTEIGRAQVDNLPGTLVTLFFITNIITKDLKSDPKTYERLALSNVNECEVINSFPPPRNRFCIDHNTGQIFTTQHFSDSKPQQGTIYTIEVQARATSEGPPTIITQNYTATVTSSETCKKINDLSKSLLLKKECSQEVAIQSGTSTVTATSFNVSFNNLKPIPFEDSVAYLVAVQVQLPKNSAVDSAVPNVRASIELVFSVDGVSVSGSFFYTLNTSINQIVYLKQPLIIRFQVNKEQKLVGVEQFYKGVDGKNIPFALPLNSYQFYLLPPTDYCSSGKACWPESEELQKLQETAMSCNIFERTMFQYKYGYCSASKAPTVSAKKYTIDIPFPNTKKIVANDYTISGADLRYKLTDIQGPTDGDIGSVFKPEECPFLVGQTPPKSFFCVNSFTGDVYSTVSYISNQIHGRTYNLSIDVSTRDFPYRSVTNIVTLVTKHECGDLSTVYNEFVKKNCPNVFLRRRASRGDFDYSFSTGNADRRLIGILIIPSPRFNVSHDSFSFEIKESGKTIKTFEATNRVITSDNNYAYYWNEYLNSATRTFQFTGNKMHSDTSFLEVVYLNSWNLCNNADCLNIYRNWKKISTPAILSNVKCRYDNQEFMKIIDTCLDLKPAFESLPVIPNQPEATISQCKYKSLINLNSFSYVLINGNTRINQTARAEVRRKRRDINDPYSTSFIMPPFQLESYEQQGKAQCVIFDPTRMTAPVLSKSINVTLKAITIFNNPRSVAVQAGGSTSLQCNIVSQALVSAKYTYWLKDGRTRIQNVIKPQIQDGTPNGLIYQVQPFFVNKVNLTHRGEYQCAVYVPSVMSQPLLSTPATITVRELILNFTSQPTWSVAKNGASVVSGCLFRAVNVVLNDDMSNFSYLQLTRDNGVSTQINLTAKITRRDDGIYVFPAFQLTSYAQTGRYSCVIFDPERMSQPIISQQSEAVNLSATQFTSQPSMTSTPKVPWDRLVITGCVFKSPFAVEQIYLEKDGTKKIYLPPNSINPGFTTIGGYSIFANLSSSGIYRCAAHPDGLLDPVFSNNIIVPPLTALEGKLVSQPKVSTRDNGQVIVEGCHYESTKELTPLAYYLVNNTFKLDLIGNPFTGERPPIPLPISPPLQNERDTETGSGLEPSNGVKKYKLVAVMVRFIGTYQCVIFDRDFMKNKVTSLNTSFAVARVPTLKNKLALTGKPINVGDGFNFDDIIFDADYPITENDVYFLRNGHEKINATFGVDTFDRISGLQTGKSTPLDQGYYQLVIFKPGYMFQPVVSDIVEIQFQNTAETQVVIKIDLPWDNDYEDPNSVKSKELSQKLEPQLSKAFKSDGITSSDKSYRIIGFSRGSVNVISSVIYTNVSKNDRINHCATINNMVDTNAFTGFKIVGVDTKNLDCCFENKTGDIDFKGVYNYDITLKETTLRKSCEYNPSDNNIRTCQPNLVTGPQWSAANLRECRPKFETTQTFINLNETQICNTAESSNCSSVSVVAKNLTVATANNSIKIQQDVTIITDTIINIVNNINTSDVNQTRQVIDDILTTYNNILDVDPNIIGKSQTVSSSSTDLLENLDVIANQLRTIINQDKNLSSLQIAKRNIAFDIRSTLRKNITVLGRGPVLESSDLELQINENNGTNLINKGIIASIEIPSTSFPNDNAIVHATLFDKASFFIPGDKLRSILGEDVSASQFIETGVISFSFGTNVTIENLTIPIIIRLRRRSSSDGLNVCVFWDFNLPSGIPGVRGDWSTRGCKYAGLDALTGLSICECDHLTNFALLLDVSQTGNNPLELQIVTWIGCAISIFGLVMTIISFLIFRKLLKKLPQKILVSLCFSLLALLIVFLAGAEQTSPRLGCQIVAGLLHYLMLTTFCWMFIEAISLYRSFITVFKSGSQTKFFWKACAFAWGLPAVIVAITAGIDHEHYGDDRICTVLGNSFYFAVLLPVALILAVNIVVLVAVMIVLVRLSAKRAERLQQDSNPFAAVRIAFACNALLGATWIFAVLAVKDATTTFQWLFCIFNSLQGFFIFLFYTVRNKDVRNEWRRLLGLAVKDGTTVSGKSLELTATAKKGGYGVSTSNSGKTKSTTYSSLSSHPT